MKKMMKLNNVDLFMEAKQTKILENLITADYYASFIQKSKAAIIMINPQINFLLILIKNNKILSNLIYHVF